MCHIKIQVHHFLHKLLAYGPETNIPASLHLSAIFFRAYMWDAYVCMCYTWSQWHQQCDHESCTHAYWATFHIIGICQTEYGCHTSNKRTNCPHSALAYRPNIGACMYYNTTNCNIYLTLWAYLIEHIQLSYCKNSVDCPHFLLQYRPNIGAYMHWKPTNYNIYFCYWHTSSRRKYDHQITDIYHVFTKILHACFGGCIFLYESHMISLVSAMWPGKLYIDLHRLIRYMGQVSQLNGCARPSWVRMGLKFKCIKVVILELCNYLAKYRTHSREIAAIFNILRETRIPWSTFILNTTHPQQLYVLHITRTRFLASIRHYFQIALLSMDWLS